MSIVTKALQDDINTAIEKGLVWLVSKQNTTPGVNYGSFGDSYKVSTTGLSVLKLESYALELGLSPFDSKYVYNKQVMDGLNYIFANAKQDANGIHFEDGALISYTTGIVLAAICAGADPSKIVTVAPLNGMTYKNVAQQIANYLAWSQADNGGWAYSKNGGVPDNSVTGYVTLGIAYGLSKSLKYELTFPDSLFTKLNNWINYIQNANGGSGYQTPNDNVNILKTGNLIEQMSLVGDALDSVRLNKAITYIANTWDIPATTGWKGTPADYQATYTTMKGLEAYNIEIIKNTAGKEINWYEDIAAVLVSQQNADGSWPKTIWDSGSIPVLSSTWALLTLEKVGVSKEAKLTLTKTTLTSSVKICDEIEYTITLKNDGGFPLNSIMLYDLLPKEVDYIEGSLEIDNNKINICNLDNGIFIGSLDEGKERTITFRVKVISKPLSGIIQNKATAKFSYVDNNVIKIGNSESNITEVKVIEIELLATKQGQLGENNEIAYNIMLINKGNIDLKNVLLVDMLPSELALVDKSVYVNNVLIENPDLLYLPIGDILIGKSAKITFKAKIVKDSYCEIKNIAVAYFSYEINKGELEYSNSNYAKSVIKHPHCCPCGHDCNCC